MVTYVVHLQSSCFLMIDYKKKADKGLKLAIICFVDDLYCVWETILQRFYKTLLCS